MKYQTVQIPLTSKWKPTNPIYSSQALNNITHWCLHLMSEVMWNWLKVWVVGMGSIQIMHKLINSNNRVYSN